MNWRSYLRMGCRFRKSVLGIEAITVGLGSTVKVIGLKIKTLEGDMRAEKGDWIIKGVNGEFYPCKPDIFEKTYEKVEAE